MSSYYMTIGGLFEYSDKININIDKIFSPSINLKTWEFETDGFDVKLPVYKDKVRLIPNTFVTSEVEIELIKSANVTDTVLIINPNDSTKATAAVGSFMWIKSEKVRITTAGIDPGGSGLQSVTVERGDYSDRTCSRNNYPVLNGVPVYITTSPRSLIGLNVRIYNTVDESLLFAGKIEDDPVMKGGITEIRVISDIEALDTDIATSEDSKATDYVIKEMLYPIENWNDRTVYSDISFLEGLEFRSQLNYVYSTFKDGIDTYKDLLMLFLKLNNQLLKFNYEYDSTKGFNVPVWEFVDFSITNTQEAVDITSNSIATIKNVKQQLTCRNYTGFGSLKLDIRGNTMTINNVAVSSFRTGEDLELTIPEGFIFKKSLSSINEDTGFNVNNWIIELFRMFGRVYQEIEVPTLSSLVLRHFEVGSFYYLNDLDKYITLVEKDLCTTENMVYCASIKANMMTLLHIRKTTKNVLPPAFIGTVKTGLQAVKYESGLNQFISNYYESPYLEANTDNTIEVCDLKVGDSGFNYYNVGDKLRINRASLSVATGYEDRAILALLGDTMVFDSALPSATFTAGDYVYIEFQPKTALTGNQLIWDFLT